MRSVAGKAAASGPKSKPAASPSRNFHCAARADFRVAAAGFAPGVLDVDGFLSLTQSYFYYMYEYLKGEGLSQGTRVSGYGYHKRFLVIF